jgi:hypothetical protein
VILSISTSRIVRIIGMSPCAWPWLVFEIGFLYLLLRLALHFDPPISTSQVAGIIALYYYAQIET